jgi:hypothetical protein
MPAKLPAAMRDVGYRECDYKIWSTWAGDERLQEAAQNVPLRVVRPSLTVVVQQGGMETIRNMEDVDQVGSNVRDRD